MTDNGYYAMVQNVNPDTNVNQFTPTIVPDNQQSIANFRVNVDKIQTISSFIIGVEGEINIEDDEREISSLTLVTADTPITVTPADYVFILTIDKREDRYFNEIFVGVNNSNGDIEFEIGLDPNYDKYYLVDTSWVGPGQGVKIPIQCNLVTPQGEVVVSFGDDEDYGDDNVPNNSYSTSMIRLKKTLYQFDFGMQPEPNVNDLNRNINVKNNIRFS